MKVIREVDARNFEFWGGARDTVKYLTDYEIDCIFDFLDSISEDEGMSETAVNDFFWFEDDTLAEWLGWTDFETLMEARSNSHWFDTADEYEEYLEELSEEEEE